MSWLSVVPTYLATMEEELWPGSRPIPAAVFPNSYGRTDFLSALVYPSVKGVVSWARMAVGRRPAQAAALKALGLLQRLQMCQNAVRRKSHPDGLLEAL